MKIMMNNLLKSLIPLFASSLLFGQDCGENMFWTECGSMCPPSCWDQNPVCVAVCVEPMCLCNFGFVFDESGNCVLPQECAEECTVPGDTNNDGDMNILDIVQTVCFITGWPDCAGNLICADIDNDGIVNVLDIVMMVNIILEG